ncbi:MAG: hypothetical protein HY830_02055 [Actinobacteria bacterium]|nr:hypothetical protein [Actinomycetota bacterium]
MSPLFRRGGRARPAETTAPLAARAIRGHLLAEPTGVWAWFALSPTRHYFADPSEREAHRAQLAARWADLVGHRIHLRITEHPYAYATWAKWYMRRTETTRLPDPRTGESFEDMVTAMQERIRDLGLTVPAAYLGVRIETRRPLTGQDLEKLLAAGRTATNLPADATIPSGIPLGVRGEAGSSSPNASGSNGSGRWGRKGKGQDADGEEAAGYRGLDERLAEVARTLDRVSASVSRPGLSGMRMSARGLAWLVNSSLTPGMPVAPESLDAATAGWDPDTVEEFTAPVHATCEPYAPAVQVRAVRGGAERTVWASVATLSRTPERALDDVRHPLFAWTRTLDYPVQWSAVWDVVDGADLGKEATRVREHLDDQIDHLVEQGKKPQRRLLRLKDHAARVEDERTSPFPDTRVRLVGQTRALVLGDSLEQAVERRDAFVKAAVAAQGALFAAHAGQWQTLREFVPGEAAAPTGFVRTIPGGLAATFGPSVATRVGDTAGPYSGYVTRTAATPFHFHPQDGPEHGRSGLQLIIATLGSGKSYVGAGTFELAVREGQHCGALDPAGKMRELLRLEHLHGQVRDMDLQHATNGLFIPWRQIPDPDEREFTVARTEVPAGEDGDLAYRIAADAAQARYEQAVQAASEERRSLAVELFMSRLPAQVSEDNPYARLVVRAGVNAAGGDYDTDPWAAVDAMSREGKDGTVFARMITESAAGLGGRLVLPPKGWRETATDMLSDCIIITARNLPIPTPGVPRRQWTEGEQFAAGMTRAASWYLTRMMYGSGQTPKFINLEEAGDIGGDESIRGLAARASLHTRKSNTALLLAVQNPLKIEQIDPEIGNLVGTTFIGNLSTGEAAQSALRIAGLPQMYAPVLLRLDVGEFLVTDHSGNTQTVAFDGEYRPHVHRLLLTNPPSKGRTIDVTGVERDGDDDGSPGPVPGQTRASVA